MNPWEKLLAVQAIDTHLDQLDHRIARLPERNAVAEAEAALATHAELVAEVESRRHALAKEQTRLEHEIGLVETKRQKSSDTMYAGANNDTKQLKALQDEIESHTRRISAFEDDEIEIMEQLEPVEAELAVLAEAGATLDQQAQAATVALAEADAAIGAEQASTRTERTDTTADIAPDALAQYETFRVHHGGIAVAKLDPNGVCGGCHMKLSAVEHDRIKHLAADEAVECEDCGRYLVRS
jgi:predicted  nucleic acid-binding Zn-ribbon protein